MSDTEFVGNNLAYTNDDLRNTNANADKLINFENARTDLNNCLHKALIEKLKPCRYYQPGQKLPVALKEIKLFMLHVNIRFLQKNLNNLNHELLQTLPYPLDILLLSETKIKLSPLTNVNLTGYQPVMVANSQTNAGGIGVYVTDKLTIGLKWTCKRRLKHFLMQMNLPLLTKLIYILIILYLLLGRVSINMLYLNMLQEKSTS